MKDITLAALGLCYRLVSDVDGVGFLETRNPPVHESFPRRVPVISSVIPSGDFLTDDGNA